MDGTYPAFPETPAEFYKFFVLQYCWSGSTGSEGKIAYTVYGRLGKTIMAKKLMAIFLMP
jgi:hypothetical protein